jgi:peptide/nickel transport system substrate-binding protein
VNACCDQLVLFRIPETFDEAKAASAAGFEPLPLLAESWEVSADGLVWTFNLRQGVVSSAGNPFTSKDFMWMVDKTFGAESAGTAKFIWFIAGVVDPGQIVAVDDFTVEMTLEAPNPKFLLAMGMPWFICYDSVAVIPNITDDDPWAQAWLNENTAGFGPYDITEFSDNGRLLRFTARPDYYGTPAIPELVYQEIPDQSSRLQLLLTGETDYAEDLTPLQLEEVENSDVGEVQRFPATTGLFMSITTEEPFSDPAVRRGIMQAMPIQDLIDNVFRGNAIPFDSPLAPWMAGWTDQFGIPEDIEAAKAAIAPIAGAELNLEYGIGTLAGEPSALLVQAALNEAGLNVSISGNERSQQQAKVAQKQIVNFVDVLNTPLFPIQAYYYDLYYDTALGFLNWTDYSNPEMDALVPALNAGEGPEFDEAVLRMQEIGMTDLPFFNLCWTGEFRATAQGLKINGAYTGNGLLRLADLEWTA